MQNTERIFLDGCNMQAPAVVLLFPALRYICLSTTAVTTANVHVRWSFQALLPLLGTVWYRAVHAAATSVSRSLTMQVRVKRNITGYFPPGGAYEIVSTIPAVLMSKLTITVLLSQHSIVGNAAGKSNGLEVSRILQLRLRRNEVETESRAHRGSERFPSRRG